jgi:hypothetical protein
MDEMIHREDAREDPAVPGSWLIFHSNSEFAE